MRACFDSQSVFGAVLQVRENHLNGVIDRSGVYAVIQLAPASLDNCNRMAKIGVVVQNELNSIASVYFVRNVKISTLA